MFKNNIFYLKKGSGQAIILLHGFSEDHSTWNDLVSLFEKNKLLNKYCLYCIDIIGHGKSDKPHELKFYEMDFIVDSIHGLLNELSIKNPIMLGYSFGGRIAMHYTLKYLTELRALVLESASFGLKNKQEKEERLYKDNALAQMIIDRGIEYFEEYWSNLPIFASQKKLDFNILQNIKKRRLNNQVLALANTLKSTGQGNLEYIKDKILALDLPILYICGELDVKYAKQAECLKNVKKNLQIQIVEDVGHNVHLEKTLEFFNILLKFLPS